MLIAALLATTATAAGGQTVDGAKLDELQRIIERQQQLIENAARWAAGEPQPIEVSAPETVESVPFEHKGKYFLHLVNKTACGPVRMVENVFNHAIPLRNITVDLNIDVTHATEQPTGRELKIDRAGGAARLTISELKIHTIICLEHL